MKPYYEDESVTLYHGDCRDVLPAIPRESLDLLLTDPPYGIGYVSGRNDFGPIAGDDGGTDVLDVLREAVVRLRRRRHVYVFGLADFGVLPVGVTAELIWDKGQPATGNLASPWAPSHERILFGVYQRSATETGRGQGGLTARLRRGTVLRYQRTNGAAVARHPTEKPVPLLRELIEMSSRPGDVVFDPFAGVGSTGVAAVLEGRRAVLIELEERYCQAAADRLRTLQRLLPGLDVA